MRRFTIDGGIPTLVAALSEHMSAGELKKLASLTGGPIPTRKAKHLEGDGLRAAWQSLDDLQRAAVAEVVHSPGTQVQADRFQAKYGRAPHWGSLDSYRRDDRPAALHFFFYGGVMPDDLKARLAAFVPPPASATVKSLAELPAVYERPWERWNPTTNLHAGLPRHARGGLRPSPQAISHRAGLLVPGAAGEPDRPPPPLNAGG